MHSLPIILWISVVNNASRTNISMNNVIKYWFSKCLKLRAQSCTLTLSIRTRLMISIWSRLNDTIVVCSLSLFRMYVFTPTYVRKELTFKQTVYYLNLQTLCVIIITRRKSLWTMLDSNEEEMSFDRVKTRLFRCRYELLFRIISVNIYLKLIVNIYLKKY